MPGHYGKAMPKGKKMTAAEKKKMLAKLKKKRDVFKENNNYPV